MKKSKKKVKTRRIHELLIILRDNTVVKSYCFGIFKRIDGGLCGEVGRLYPTFITFDESERLLKYITKNRPIWIFYFNYGWRPKLWRPSLKWLNRQIVRTKYSKK